MLRTPTSLVNFQLPEKCVKDCDRGQFSTASQDHIRQFHGKTGPDRVFNWTRGRRREWCGQREDNWTSLINDKPEVGRAGCGQDTSTDERQEVDDWGGRRWTPAWLRASRRQVGRYSPLCLKGLFLDFFRHGWQPLCSANDPECSQAGLVLMNDVFMCASTLCRLIPA